MKKLALTLSVPLALAVTLAAAALAAAPAVDGKTLFAKCTGCHGADGSKTAMSKALKGRKADELAKELHGYKAKTFGGAKKAVMEGQAAGLSDADIKALAEYISKL